MNKSKQKREKYHPLAVNKIAEMYGFSARYIRQILKGDRKGLMADNVLLVEQQKLSAQFQNTADLSLLHYQEPFGRSESMEQIQELFQ